MELVNGHVTQKWRRYLVLLSFLILWCTLDIIFFLLLSIRSRHIMLQFTSRDVTACHKLGHVLSHDVTSRYVVSRHVMFWRILSIAVIPSCTISCHIHWRLLRLYSGLCSIYVNTSLMQRKHIFANVCLSHTSRMEHFQLKKNTWLLLQNQDL